MPKSEIQEMVETTASIRNAVLEEAARIADSLESKWTAEWRAGLKANSHLEGMSDGAGEVASAIRQLKTI